MSISMPKTLQSHQGPVKESVGGSLSALVEINTTNDM